MASEGDVERAAAAGADAVLIGTALSSAADPDALLEQLSGGPPPCPIASVRFG